VLPRKFKIAFEGVPSITPTPRLTTSASAPASSMGVKAGR
jgi:hypothetical protein